MDQNYLGLIHVLHKKGLISAEDIRCVRGCDQLTTLLCSRGLVTEQELEKAHIRLSQVVPAVLEFYDNYSDARTYVAVSSYLKGRLKEALSETEIHNLTLHLLLTSGGLNGSSRVPQSSWSQAS